MQDDGDRAAADPAQFDFRADGKNAEGVTFTLARYRVDFKQRTVLLYDPVTADYQDLPGSAALFATTDRN